MSISSTIRVAVVGTGFGQAIHIPGLVHHPRTEVIAVHNRNLEKAQAIADSHRIPYAFNSLEKLLSLPELDAVALSTPPFLHYEMGQQILQAGKHLLLEKPMAMSAQETKALYHLAKKKNVVVTTDFEFRYVPAWQLLSDYLQQGYVGKIRLIKIDWLVASRANPERPWNWYSRRDQGGGVLGAVGSHAFDYIHWLFGPVKRLSAQLSCTIKERPDPQENGKLKPVDADDTCLLLLELADGTPCQMSLSSVTYNGRGHWVEVYGDRGTLILGSDNLKDYVHGFHLQAAPAGKSLTELEIPKSLAFPQVFTDGRLAPFIRIVDRWVESIDQGQSLVPSLYEGVYSQLLMDLTHQSNDNQCWVNVPNLDQFLA
ncbi:oxidoreductase domain protein [Rippkaea orientalis PCC 8801]|uniref:Oxidoreductase domain protein n=1 Tax=Rippkaea orientalis (strain PCC 8801 / RF-1) TaxID=41431 RepID=B7K0H6_RIPO1|nr:Gfo/Idh/MocA family oxidoreductase [Rippkaea orientalis]ACK67460.1 oxidoreductase domain protein [Rippkaea orientalis PCC 8801]